MSDKDGDAARLPSRRYRWRHGVVWLPALVAACVSDVTLLDENSAVALRSARVQARQDLYCPAANVHVVSEKEVPGAPWGYLYSDYRIRAEGCGRAAFYDVECRDESLCDVKQLQP